jgi:hypothetical protein
MEVGKCTSKVIKELKQKDKVDGRFFHTSDTDEWFFCWGGKLQKLNLKGDADVNDALDEVRELINKAEVSVENANKTAEAANAAAESAQNAAKEANAAVESIGNKADKSDVEAVEKEVELKADKSVVDELSDKVDAIKVPSLEGYATEAFVGEKIAEKVPTKVSAFENDANYLTHQDISGKQDVIDDLDDIRSGAAAGATALQKIPEEYVKETDLAEKGYLTKDAADLLYAPIGTTGSGESIDLSKYAEKEYVDNNFDASGSADAALSAAKEYADGLVKDEEGNVLFESTGAAATAEKNAKDYADSLSTNYEVAGASAQALVDAKADAASLYQVKGDYLTHQDISGKQDVIEDLADIRDGAAAGAVAEQNAKDYADGLASNYDAAGAAAAAETAAKTYTDSKLASIEEELERITNKILGV